jgi:metal-dependent amidase/aminoacylase/carboxypeptidase family protein
MMSRVQQRGGLSTCIGIGADVHGTRKEDADRSASPPAHSDVYDFDEAALPLAVRLLCGVVVDLCRGVKATTSRAE